MKRIVKIFGLLLVVLIVVIAAAVFYGLHKFKNFPEVKTVTETIDATAEELAEHIETIVSFGVRNPGTPGDKITQTYIMQKFSDYGLKSVKRDPFDIPMFHPKSWSLSLKDNTGSETVTIPCSYIPFSASTDEAGITAPLVYVGQGDTLDDLDLQGKIAVYEMKFKPKGLKTYSKILFMYDPDNTLESSARVVRAGLEFEYKMYEMLKSKGAVGMVGLLSGLQWDSDRYYPQMSFGLEKSIPGVWVRPSHCDRVRKWAGKENAVGSLVMTAETSTGQTANVYGVLPGQIDEYYLVFSQHDTYFDGAVQDASGVAVILALAKHFSETSSPLKRGIVFMTVAHTNGRSGELNFIKRHRNDFLSKTALVIAVEHIGLELDPQPDLKFTVSERPSFRMFFTALNQDINGIVKSAVIDQDFRRSVILPQWLVEKITGKARGISAEFHEIGLPVIGFMSNPPYMFFAEDTMAAVAIDQLVPTANLMATILRTADGYELEDLH